MAPAKRLAQGLVALAAVAATIVATGTPAFAVHDNYEIWPAYHSSLVLDIAGNNGSWGNKLIISDSNGQENQRFWFSANPHTGYARMHVENSDLCIVVQNASHDNGAKIMQWGCNGTANEYWRFEGSSPHLIRNLESGKCIDVPNWDYRSGVELVQWDCNGGTNQRFNDLFYNN